MNDKDKAAFEAWYLGFHSKGASLDNEHAFSYSQCFESALAHRDAQVAGLVEVLRYIGHDGEHNLNHLTNEEMARQALTAWEASK